MLVQIVEDSELVGSHIRELIGELPGIRIVGPSRTASEALSLFEDQRPDALVLDLRLAEGNGIDVLHAVKASLHPPAVVVLTNHPFPEYRRRCLAAGAEFFLEKARQFEELPSVLRQILASRARSV